MIVVYAGRRPSGDDGVFPSFREEYTRERVERMLAGLRPARVVGSAAAGSDLVILEVAATLGIPAVIVIGGDAASFAAGSVDDKAGWRARYDAVLAAPQVTVEHVPAAATGDADTYRAVTRRMIERAVQLRDDERATDPDAELVGMLLTGGSRGDGDYTEDLGLQLEAAGHLVLRVDPARGRESSPVAFVAMPFGRRKDPTSGNRRYESDPTWYRLLLPALLATGYRPVRTDVEASRALIDGRMVRDLLSADLVVVDLATLNANVFWELGVRHAARPQGTLVVGPARLSPPFDVRAVPVLPYHRHPDAVTDSQSVAGIRELREAIRSISSEPRHGALPDSPVHAAVPSLELTGLPDRPGRDPSWTERITVATEIGDPDSLLQIVQALDRADLPQAARESLRIEVGFALVRLGRHSDAVDVLAPAARADRDYENERLQQQYAHALVRAQPASAGRDEDLRLAEHRLRVLDGRRPGSGETLGLLGSVTKERALLRHLQGQDATGELRIAADAYHRGFVADPSDHYPGVNAIALLRVLGQSDGANADDLATVRRLIPVVRFAVDRSGISDEDVWGHATLGELSLHEHLLDGDPTAMATAARHYTQAAAQATPQQLGSMARQLELLRAWGAPEGAVRPLMEPLRARM